MIPSLSTCKLNSSDGVCVDQYPKDIVSIGLGGSIKLSAHVTTSSPETFMKWQKVEGNSFMNLLTDSTKYSGSVCNFPTADLIINHINKKDEGIYQLSVTTFTGIVTGPKVLLKVFGGKICILTFNRKNTQLYFVLH